MSRLLTVPAQRTGKFIVLIAALLVVAALSPLSGKFEDAQDNETVEWLPGDAESVKALKAIERFPDGEISPAVTVITRPGGLNADDRARAQQLVEDLNRTPPPHTRGTQGPIPSADGAALLVVTQVENTGGTGDEFLDSVKSVRERAHALRGDGRQVEVTGAAGFGADAIEVFGDINGQLLLAAGGLVLILLILIYRSPIFWAIPFFTVLFAEASARGLGYLLAEAGVTINGQSGGILPVLVFGAGTDYALLLVARYREELRRHDSSHEAMQLALRTAGPAIFFSGLTVMAALLVLSIAEVNSTAGLGPIGAMGIAMAMLFMLTMLPALLVVCGRRAFWPFVPDGPAGPVPPHSLRWRRIVYSLIVGGLGAAIGSAGGGAGAGIGFVVGALLNYFVLAPAFHRFDLKELYPGIERKLAERHRISDETHGVWRRIGERVAARPGRVAVVTTLALLVLSAGLLQLDTGLTSGNSFRGEVEAVRGLDVLSEHFPAGANTPTTVVIPDRADVEPVRAALERDPAVAAVGDPVSGPPGTKVDIQLKADPYSTEAFEQIPHLRRVAKAAGGPDVVIGGETAAAYDVRKSATRDNYVIIPIALVVVFAILAVLLRALVAPAVLVGTVILSFAAALGTGMFFSKTVFGFPGIDPTLPLLCFIFLVALGIDYNIFLMARVREETARHGTREGMLRGLAVTGAVITSAGIVLAGTFGALAVLPLIFLTEIGFIVAFGVLLDTFVVRSILVPALTFLLDRRIWWPSRLMR
ncbi:MAG TPA: MMPL family transporter [Solirubrobacteraceae bacterium]|nr:MMPL family transporter [Solirubrobacteraceae bacterium]